MVVIYGMKVLRSFILDEATVLRDRLQTDQLFVENHLAWPQYTKKENTKWYANYKTVVNPVSANIPDDVKGLIQNEELFLEPNCPAINIFGLDALPR